MSIIAVNGFAAKYSLNDAVKMLARPINGNFEALTFKASKGKKSNKALRTCYIRLSEKLDPIRVIQQINDFKFNTKIQYKAHIPDKVPDIPLRSKPKNLPPRVRMALRIPEETPIETTMLLCTEEIVVELQMKYPGLYSLSKKYEHKLIQELAKIIYKRVQELAKKSTDVDTCFKLAQAYRRAYPHFGDFQLVLDQHHAIQDAAGVPRMQLQESDIASMALPPNVFNLPITKLRQLRNKFSDKILHSILEHIKELDSEVTPNDTGDVIARKQVRSELKKLSPFLSPVVNQLMDKHFMPASKPLYRMRIYGEPFLPGKEVLQPFLARFKPTHVMRSIRMYNMVQFSVAPYYYHSLVAMNGTMLNGAKLIIRCSDTAQYSGVKSALEGKPHVEIEEAPEVPMEEDEDEEEDDWEEQELEL